MRINNENREGGKSGLTLPLRRTIPAQGESREVHPSLREVSREKYGRYAA